MQTSALKQDGKEYKTGPTITLLASLYNGENNYIHIETRKKEGDDDDDDDDDDNDDDDDDDEEETEEEEEVLP
ncbi:hypothetical protein STEG23_014085 [Scotinomys teguina]